MLYSIRFYWRILGFRGMCFAALGKLTGKARVIEVTREDCRHPFKLRVPSSDIQAYRQIFTKQDYAFSVRRDPATIIDAGANIGLAAIYFANKYPDAKIVSIEAEKKNFDLLSNNVSGYANIYPVHAALWHRDDQVNLMDPGLGEWGFMADAGSAADSAAEPISSPATLAEIVPGKTVSTIMRDHEMDQVDVLKMDIEGAEREVFSDSAEWIENVGSLVVELHERMKIGCNRSFYNNSSGFQEEWLQGENICLSRADGVLYKEKA